MSVQTGRMVSADEARDWNHHEGDLTEGDLAYTVTVQAEQIAAVRALAERWQSVAADLDESRVRPRQQRVQERLGVVSLAAIFGTQAGCGEAILKALGVSGE